MEDLAKAGMAMPVVTHETGFAKEIVDRVIFMDGGYILGEDTPTEIFDNPQHGRTKGFLAKII